MKEEVDASDVMSRQEKLAEVRQPLFFILPIPFGISTRSGGFLSPYWGSTLHLSASVKSHAPRN